MPRLNTANVMAVDITAIQAYCGTGQPAGGLDVLTDAVVNGDHGAYALVELLCAVRSNRRSRRTMGEVRREMTRPPTQRPRWLRVLGESAFALWRLMRRQVQPMEGVRQHASLRHLSRDTTRLLRSTGAVNVQIPLRVRARRAAEALWAQVTNSQCVLWIDNFAWLRWGTDPAHPNYSQNVTALAILDVGALQQRDVRTRAITFPYFPGHRSLDAVVGYLPWEQAVPCRSYRPL
jgi:hypothetical protein